VVGRLIGKHREWVIPLQREKHALALHALLRVQEAEEDRSWRGHLPACRPAPLHLGRSQLSECQPGAHRQGARPRRPQHAAQALSERGPRGFTSCAGRGGQEGTSPTAVPWPRARGVETSAGKSGDPAVGRKGDGPPASCRRYPSGSAIEALRGQRLAAVAPAGGSGGARQGRTSRGRAARCRSDSLARPYLGGNRTEGP